jgi:hypothetical protein
MSGDAPKHQMSAAVKDNQLPAAGVCKKSDAGNATNREN